MKQLFTRLNKPGAFLVLVLANAFAAHPALADADTDWIVRSTAPGVYTAVGFDTQDEVVLWTFPDGTADHVRWEQTLKASGSGSLRFDIRKTDRAGSGSWVHWLSDNQREFTTGNEFYVQFRQYIPAYYATHKFVDANGWKQIIISRHGNIMGGINVPQPYGSNQLNEVVLQNTNHRGILQGYNRDSDGNYPPWEVSANTRCSATDFVMQNAIDRGIDSLTGLSTDGDPWTPCEQDRARYGGLYSFYSTKPDGYVAGAPDPIGGAFNYYPDEWITFYLRVRLGIYGGNSHDTRVTLWAARESDSDYTLVIDRDDIDLGNGPNHDSIWLLPYNTGRSPDPNREDTYTLYDELIVSANPIPAPTAGLTFSFFASTTSLESGGSVTLTWAGDAANSCVASGDWSGNKAGAGSESVGPLTQNSSFVLQCTGPEGASTRSAHVSVTPVDNIAPTIERVTASGDPNVVKVTFSEAVELSGAEAASNYAVSPGIAVLSATREPGSDDVVRLDTSTLNENTTYAIAISNVSDQSNAQNAIASNSQANFVYYASLAGRNTNPSLYQWSTLDVGELVYIDRPYTYYVVPAQYIGFDYLLTANGDKNITDAEFLSFDLPQAATVFVGHDRRITSKPAWLSTWSDNGDDIYTSDATFDIFERDFPAGPVNIGGNLGNGSSMYFVMVGPSAPPSGAQPTANNDTVSTSRNFAVLVDVLANDLGVTDLPVTVKIVNEPANGGAIVTNNKILYIPSNTFSKADRFSYRITDANGDQDDAEVTIFFSKRTRNSLSVANDATTMTTQKAASSINAQANDTVVNDSPLTVAELTPVSKRAATVKASQAQQASAAPQSGGGAAHPLLLLLVGLLGLLQRANPLKRFAGRPIVGSRKQTARAFLFTVLAMLATTGAASQLSDTAAAMSPGTFVEFETQALTHSMMTQNGCSSPITSYTDNAIWDPVSRRFLFIGGPHGCPHAFVQYSEATNSWSNLSTFSTSALHAYDHTTIDTEDRILYFRQHSSGGFHSYNLNSASWTIDALPAPPTSYFQVSGGLEYFPAINRLVHINYGGFGEIHLFESGAWNKVDDASMGERANFIEYNPVHELLLFGGGVTGNGVITQSREIYAMDANQNIVQKTDAPIDLSITSSIVTVDPVSGKYLVFANDDLFYEYDIVNDSWKSLPTSVPFLETVYEPNVRVFGTVATPVSTHGVIMFLQYLGSGSKVWLYKHRDSGPPDVTPPTSPTNVTGTGISASSISLSWSAAFDPESGVSSYEIYRNDLQIGNAYATSYVDTGLTDATPYNYQVAALNGSSLAGSRSPITVVSTQPDVVPPTVVSAFAFGDTGMVTVGFSETVEKATAENPANYAISAGVSVFAAQRSADQQTVVLSTSALVASVSYSLTVNNVTDQATTPNWIASNSQIGFEFVPSLAGDNTLPGAYVWGRLTEDALTFVDRTFYYSAVPAAYDGLDYLQTANNDKGASGVAFLSFDLPQAATVYVAHDVRAISLPAWLSSWSANGDSLITSDTTYNLYAREFAAGPVSLGGNEGSSPSMYTVVVGPATGGPVDLQPLASSDSGSTQEGTAIGIDVLANDSALGDVPITVTLAANPAYGSASVLENSIVAYTPDAGFVGIDSLTYQVTDGDGDSSTATVSIKVNATGRDAKPTAMNDILATQKDTAMTFDVTANDTGLSDAPVALSIVAAPNKGIAFVVNGHSIRYTPAKASTGVDTLTYQIADADGDTSQATVIVVVFDNVGSAGQDAVQSGAGGRRRAAPPLGAAGR